MWLWNLLNLQQHLFDQVYVNLSSRYVSLIFYSCYTILTKSLFIAIRLTVKFEITPAFWSINVVNILHDFKQRTNTDFLSH